MPDLEIPVVHVEIDIITAKPYDPPKSLFSMDLFKIICVVTYGMIIFELHGCLRPKVLTQIVEEDGRS